MVRSIHPSNYLHPPIYLSIYRSIYLSNNLHIYLSTSRSIYIHLSTSRTIYLSIPRGDITHSPSSLHVSTILFCSTGTSHGFISTPRSPLATMIPSDRSTIYRIVVWVLYQVTWSNTSYRTYGFDDNSSVLHAMNIIIYHHHHHHVLLQ
jgi:hypothetical protein